MTGQFAGATLQHFYADVCIVGAVGIDLVVGVTELDYESAALHCLMIERAPSDLAGRSEQTRLSRLPSSRLPCCSAR